MSISKSIIWDILGKLRKFELIIFFFFKNNSLNDLCKPCCSATVCLRSQMYMNTFLNVWSHDYNWCDKNSVHNDSSHPPSTGKKASTSELIAQFIPLGTKAATTSTISSRANLSPSYVIRGLPADMTVLWREQMCLCFNRAYKDGSRQSGKHRNMTKSSPCARQEPDGALQHCAMPAPAYITIICPKTQFY